MFRAATQSPIAFVEGIYVLKEYRKQGIGTALIRVAQQWALEQGCIELTLDALIDNTASYAFHTRLGFREAERVVFFIQSLPAAESARFLACPLNGICTRASA